MALGAYAGTEDYAALFPDEDAVPETELAAASRAVDAMTYGRIRALGGVEALTAFQRELVREAVCRQARFLRQNGEMLASPVTSYAIGSVSLRLGNASAADTRGGVTAPVEVRSLLDMTGLTDRTLGRSEI